MVSERLDTRMTEKEAPKATPKRGKSAEPEATVIEPVAAQPLGTYPEYNEDGTVKEPEQHDDEDKS